MPSVDSVPGTQTERSWEAYDLDDNEVSSLWCHEHNTPLLSKCETDDINAARDRSRTALILAYAIRVI